MRSPDGITGLVSIHDVMPETLDAVDGLLALLGRHELHPATLLVVPGRQWDHRAIDRLRQWQAAGHELAAHGWCHRAVAERTSGHRIHAALISRDAGEHLSRPRRELIALMVRSHRWFGQQGLDPPRLYVPPAWALGTLRRVDLADTPFSLVESLSGMHLPRLQRFVRLPVAGFEADTAWRACALRTTNRFALALARSGWLRVALHPHDLRLRLTADVHRMLPRIDRAAGHGELLSPESTGAR